MIIAGQEFHPPTPLPSSNESVGPTRFYGARASFGLVGSLLLVAVGIYTLFTSTIGVVIGLVLVVIGFTMMRSALRYLREFRYIQNLPTGIARSSRTDEARPPVYVGGVSGLPALINEVDRIEREAAEQESEQDDKE